MMKHLLLFAFLLLSVGMHAQNDNILERILQVNSSASSFESDLCNTTTKHGNTTVQNGILYFVKPDKFAALFTAESYMIANANKLKIDIGLFHGKFTMRKNGILRSLSNIFLYGFQGRCRDLAEENNYSICLKETGQCCHVTFTNNRRNILGIGFKQVIFRFEKESLKLLEIVLIDTTGTIDSYAISNVKYNVEVDPNKFATN